MYPSSAETKPSAIPVRLPGPPPFSIRQAFVSHPPADSGLYLAPAHAEIHHHLGDVKLQAVCGGNDRDTAVDGEEERSVRLAHIDFLQPVVMDVIGNPTHYENWEGKIWGKKKKKKKRN